MSLYRVLRIDTLRPTYIATIDAETPEAAVREAVYHDPASGIENGKSKAQRACYEAHYLASATVVDVTWRDGRFVDAMTGTTSTPHPPVPAGD
jgi:hypothetical protein